MIDQHVSLCKKYRVCCIICLQVSFVTYLFDSRAHTIVSVTFTQNKRKEKTSTQSVINLVDLAGRLYKLIMLPAVCLIIYNKCI